MAISVLERPRLSQLDQEPKGIEYFNYYVISPESVIISFAAPKRDLVQKTLLTGKSFLNCFKKA